MSIDLTENLDEVERKEGGRGLRARLEAALAELKDSRQERASLKAEKVIGDHGLSLVKPEDLAGVSVDDLEERAKALQAERIEAQKDLARSVFAKKGLEGDELEAAVEDFIAPVTESNPTPEGAEELPDILEFGRMPGNVSDPRIPRLDEGMSGVDYLRAAEAQAARR